MSSLKETASISPSRYLGRVCDKHHGLNGERYKRNRCCVGCQRDWENARRKKPEIVEARSEKERYNRAIRRRTEQIQQMIISEAKFRAMTKHEGKTYMDYIPIVTEEFKAQGKC